MQRSRRSIIIRALVLVLALGAVMALSAFSATTINNKQGTVPEKVTICHRPPDNPDNAQTITVAEPAVAAHLAHGDTLGACPGTNVQSNRGNGNNGNGNGNGGNGNNGNGTSNERKRK